jgi:hypothetical protein
VDTDDLVIGSGLAALGAVLGLLTHPERRITVLAGSTHNQFAYYDARRTVPCAYLGPGGLGTHWHGVIPLGLNTNFAHATPEQFAAFFARFYPHAPVQSRVGSPSLFVPWRAIRPAQMLQQLAAQHPQQLQCVAEAAIKLTLNAHGATVITPSGAKTAHRVWVAAGALHTPSLLAHSFGPTVQRGWASDHVFCYVGQVDGAPAPRVTYSRDGAFFPARYDASGAAALYTLRPAAFAFKQLDFGMEQRAVFGLPTGSAVAKIARRMSPGLLVEAFYNRFGLFAHSHTHSVYAQVPVVNAYEFPLQTSEIPLREGTPLRECTATIHQATQAARAAQPYADLRASNRPDIHLPGIHLHHTLDVAAAAELGLNTANSPIQVIDASALTHIGPDHHSFKMMLAAYQRAAL